MRDLSDPLDGIPIRSITIGVDPLNGFSFRVGQELTLGSKKGTYKVKVSSIIRNTNGFERYGEVFYKIFITREGYFDEDGNLIEQCLKSFKDVPMKIDHSVEWN